jgi:glycerol-3-phosphate acyltransferase PlsY
MCLNIQNVYLVFLFATMAYLLGSLNTTIVAFKLLRLPDPRATGSGNPGATNTLRTTGPRVALPVLLVDLGKAYGTIWLGRSCGLAEDACVLAVPYVLGNLYPVFHRFRGGKGVAAAVGTLFAISPLAMFLGGLFFLLIVITTKFVSLASLLMLLSTSVWMWFAAENTSAASGGVAGFLFLSAVFAHRHNLMRLVQGTEPKIGWTRRDTASHT